MAQPCVDPTLIDSTAICPTVYDPVCGCDGITYANQCIAINYGGLTSWVPGECGSSSCVDTSLIDTTAMCPMIYQPVCGCDGITYDNSCFAINYGGLTSWVDGECQMPGPDTCLVIPTNIDFGACTMALGVIRQNDSCYFVSGCSTTGSNGFDYSGYFYNSIYQCESLCMDDTTITLECIDTNIIDLSVMCNGLYEPVCGCDSITYHNACIAVNYYGITGYQPGPCDDAFLEEKDKQMINVFPNPVVNLLSFSGGRLNEVKEIRILSLDGRPIMKNINLEGVNLNDIPQGLYTVHFYFNDRSHFFQQIIKQ